MTTRVLPHLRDHRTAVAVGVALFLLGSWFLHDAYEGRGRKAPFVMRPFTWW